MALKIKEAEVVKTLKVRLIEVREYEPCKWEPTGRSLYVDRDAPLYTLDGWAEGCRVGVMSVRKSLFDQIVKIVDQAMKTADMESD